MLNICWIDDCYNLKLKMRQTMRRLTFLLLSFCFLLGTAIAQNNRTISGTVKNEQGAPVSNASVVVKGTTIGTNTNDKGEFSLSVPASAKRLVISSLNFESTEVAIGSAPIGVTLVASAGDLDEVVVSVPYGTIKKTAFTGSAGTVTAATISKQQVTSVTRVLEGLIPGVQATNGGGAPGSGAAIRLRGIGSVNASSEPLYVVNGVPYDGSISAINSDEIESVDVLKDAAATNLYGSRAANGVIMITTKKGKKGAAAITGSVRHSFQTRGIPEYDRVNSGEYYELFWEAYRNSYVYGSGQTFAAAGVNASNVLTGTSGLVYNAYNVPGNQLVNSTTGKLNPNAQLLWDESWADALFRNAQRTNASINISGATDKMDYFVSGGYLNEEGIAKFSGYQRYNFRTTVNVQATEWLKAGINFDGSSDKRDGLFAGGTATSNPFYYSRQMGPIYPVYQKNTTTGANILDANGQPVLDFGIPTQMGSRPYAANSNLLGSLALDVRGQKRFNGNINPYVEVKFLKDFSFKTTLGLNYSEVDQLTYQNSQYGDAVNVSGRATQTFAKQTSLTGNEILSWNKNIKKHSIRALVGHENYEYKYKELSATKTGFAYPGFTALSNAAVVESPPSSYEDIHRIESYFGSVNYTLDNKYLASASVRTDGSSRFAAPVRWGNFYSFGAGWRISQENFMKNVNWVNELKLKASYGASGNDNLGSTSELYYQYIGYYYADGFGNYAPIIIPGVGSRKPNPDLVWEANTSTNFGLEFTLFKRRLQGSIEIYDRRSKDLIFDVPQGPSSPLGSTQYQNIGESKNTGIEIQLGYNAIRKKNFDWRIDFNISSFKNVITKLPPGQKEVGIVNGTKKLTEGKSIYDFWLRDFAGVDAATGLATYYQDVLGSNGKPTGQKLLTSDITKASYYYVGASAIPKFQGGFTNAFRYKNFDLSILTTFSYGGYFYDGNYQSIMHSGSAGTHWSSDIKARWQKPGDVTNVPRLQNATNQDGASSRFLFDASYLNIKNITLGYNLSASAAKKLHLKDLQFFVNVDNAMIFTAKKGGDPQQSFNGTVSAAYPPFRTFTIGTTIKL